MVRVEVIHVVDGEAGPCSPSPRILIPSAGPIDITSKICL